MAMASILSSALLALAAVAAALALHTAMVLAGILGAKHTDLGGRLTTDAAREGNTLTHSSDLLLRFAISLGWRRAR
jgi:hypothetical protein